MPLQVKEGYTNPLTMMNQKKNGLTKNNPLMQKSENMSNEIKKLQDQKMAIQNKMLLMKSTTNGGQVPKQAQKSMEREMEQISEQIKELESTINKNPAENITKSSEKLRFDVFENSQEEGQ